MGYTTKTGWFFPEIGDDVESINDFATMVQALQDWVTGLAHAFAPAGGFFSASDFYPSIISGQMKVQFPAGSRAFVNDLLIYEPAAIDVGTGNADGVPVGSGGGTLNYYFLKPDGTWHIDQDNTAPANSIPAANVTYNATEATLIARPTGRVDLTAVISLLSKAADDAIADGVDYSLGTGTGTKIGTAVGQKLGFWNVAPVVQPAAAGQAALAAMAPADNFISGLTISNPPTQADVQAFRNACETLRDTVAANWTLLDAIRTALVNAGLMKGAA